MEETASFLQALLASHGPNYLEKLFGNKARDALAPLGGVNKVAIALSGKFYFFNLSFNIYNSLLKLNDLNYCTIDFVIDKNILFHQQNHKQSKIL